MVKFRNGMRGLTPFALGALALYSCSDDDENLSNNDLLIGEWKVISLDGESYVEEYEDYSYAFGFKFEADGDFGYCYEYINNSDPSENEKYCETDGEWEWLDDDQTQLKIWDGINDDYSITLSIRTITSKRMEGDFEGDGAGEFVFEKYDFEE